MEDAAISFVMNLARASGRKPIDRRYEAAFTADLDNASRIIEVKAAGGRQ